MITGGFAGTITGALSVNGSGVKYKIGGVDADMSTIAGGILSGTHLRSASADSDPGSKGDYEPVPELADYGPFTIDLATIASGGGFSLSSATYGQFTATFGILNNHSCQSNPLFNCSLDVYLRGFYTPGPGLDPLLDPTDTSVRIGFTQNGHASGVHAYSGSGTLSSPAEVLTPEPTGMLLIGGGLIGLVGFARRRRSA